MKHPEANFAQSDAWARANELMGHTVISKDFGDGDYAVMIIKNAKRGRYMEIPAGPLLDWNNAAKVKQIFTEIQQIAHEHRCVFVRFRPQLMNSEANCRILALIGARRAPMHLAAEHTVMIDLTPSEDELLANMRRQTRYEVRRAAKLGIEVVRGNSEELFREFHAVQSETAARQHFVPPDLKTLLAEREAFGDNAWIYKAALRVRDMPPEGGAQEGSPRVRSQLRREAASDPATAGVASVPAENLLRPVAPIAYGLILADGAEGVYYEAASTDLNRKLPGAYALQWQVIKDLKQQGIKRYNLWGIAPPDQPNHRYAGVTTFKTGFGGEVIEYVPAHDLVINPAKYTLNLAVETIRKKRRHLS